MKEEKRILMQHQEKAMMFTPTMNVYWVLKHMLGIALVVLHELIHKFKSQEILMYKNKGGKKPK